MFTRASSRWRGWLGSSTPTRRGSPYWWTRISTTSVVSTTRPPPATGHWVARRAPTSAVAGPIEDLLARAVEVRRIDSVPGRKQATRNPLCSQGVNATRVLIGERLVLSMGNVGVRPFSVEARETIWDMREALVPVKRIAKHLGRHNCSVRTFIAATGGRRPHTRERCALRLSLAEREEISRGLAGGLSFRAIAQGLGRSASTVCREVN